MALPSTNVHGEKGCRKAKVGDFKKQIKNYFVIYQMNFLFSSLDHWRLLQEVITNSRIDYSISFEDSLDYYQVFIQNARNMRLTKPRDVMRMRQCLKNLSENDVEFPQLELLPLPEILEKGSVYDKSGLKYKLVQPKRSHSNAFLLYYLGVAKKICTGFVLNTFLSTGEKRWAQHSWGLDANNCIIETTAKVYDMYFGAEVPVSDLTTVYQVPSKQLVLPDEVEFDSLEVIHRVWKREHQQLLAQFEKEGHVTWDEYYVTTCSE